MTTTTRTHERSTLKLSGRIASAVVGLMLAGALSASSSPKVARSGAGTAYAPNGPCHVAGTFLVTAPPLFPDLGDQTLLASVTISPSDSTCRRFSFSLVPVNPELSFAGIFPEATLPPGLFGSMVREGGEYRLFAIAHSPGSIPDSLPIRAPVVYFWTYQGGAVCSEEACGSLLLDGVVSLYGGIDDPERAIPELGIDGVFDQDRDEDGFADPGEEPILVAPFPLQGRRVMP